jgi:hypothetical protein
MRYRIAAISGLGGALAMTDSVSGIRFRCQYDQAIMLAPSAETEANSSRFFASAKESEIAQAKP